MRILKVIICLILLCFILKCNVKAQSDTIIVESEVVQNIDDFYYRNKYNYLDITLSDNLKLLKLGVQPFKPNNVFSFAVLTVTAGYERKLNQSFTINNELKSILYWDKGTSLHQYGYAWGIRYYPLKKKQIENGESGNNCNGYYVGSCLRDVFGFISYRNEMPVYELRRVFDFQLKPEFLLGLQQRINNRLYFDASISGNYNILDNEFGFGMTFLFGGALSLME